MFIKIDYLHMPLRHVFKFFTKWSPERGLSKSGAFRNQIYNPVLVICRNFIFKTHIWPFLTKPINISLYQQCFNMRVIHFLYLS